jgi:alpha-tubulin suppressor-like RCC1 family protein
MKKTKANPVVTLLSILFIAFAFIAVLSYTRAKLTEPIDVFAATERIIAAMDLLQASENAEERALAITLLQESINSAKQLLAETDVGTIPNSPNKYSAPQSAHDALQYAIDLAQAVLDSAMSQTDTVPKVTAGNAHTVALATDGTVWAWGINSSGQLGDGTATRRTTPVEVPNLADITEISAGHNHTVALDKNGNVWTWGSNSDGQLGNGGTTSRNTAAQVEHAEIRNITAIAAGGEHTVVLRNDGTVWAWGSNNRGQLGNDTMDDSFIPVQAFDAVKAISASANHTVAIRNDGTVWAWGSNNRGKLGDGTIVNRSAPVKVQNITDVTAISAGGTHTLAMKNDGTVWGWGSNISGNVGDDTTIDRHTPVHVSTLNNVLEISAGSSFSSARLKDGTVWTWGSNAAGQIGDGSGINRRVPVYVQDINSITAITAGAVHTIAVRSDGYVFAWGNNNNGELGDNTTTQKPSPVQVLGQNAIGYLNLGESESPLPPDSRAWTAMVFGDGVLAVTSGDAIPGSTITLTLYARTDYILTGLSVSGTGIVPGAVNLTARTIQFAMPSGTGSLAVTVTPTWVYDPPPVIRNWTATVSGVGTLAAPTSGNATVGTLITLTLNARTDYRLTDLTVSGTGITPGAVNLTARTIRFAIPDGTGNLAVTVTPTWVYDPVPISYSVISNIVGGGTVERSHTSATAGTLVTFEAFQNDDYRFIRWEVQSGGITLSSTTNRITTFIMPNNAVTVRAVFETRWRLAERTYNLSGQMALSLPSGDSGRSSAISVNVTNLPADAEVVSITVNVGNSSGSIIPSSLRVTCSSRPGHNMDIPWTGQQNTPIGGNRLDFWNHEANALYQVSWYGTNTSLMPQTRTFGNVSITIEYTYRVN